jgi:hypothetical protein
MPAYASQETDCLGLGGVITDGYVENAGCIADIGICSSQSFTFGNADEGAYSYYFYDPDYEDTGASTFCTDPSIGGTYNNLE